MSNATRMVFFRSDGYDISAAQRRLTKERGVSATRVGEGLLVQFNNGRKVRVVLSNAQQVARDLSITSSSLAGLGECDAQFEISSENPDHVSDEFNEVDFVADTLRYATQGYLFTAGSGEVCLPPDEVWKLCSGPLTDGEIKGEIDAIIGLLLKADVQLVLASYGFGCRCEGLAQTEGIPVATNALSDFVRRSMDRGIYTMGMADLKIQSGDGRIRFLLCHEADVHCSGPDSQLMQIIRERWAWLYQKSTEQDEREGTFISLSGRMDIGAAT